MASAPTSIFQSSEIRIVEASAGSGKTFALAKRYVQLLLMLSSSDSRAMRHILAITFTNKAAFEMKARILEFLKSIAFGQLKPSEEEQILRPLNLSAKGAAPLAVRVMDELLFNYNYFQVQTIDKFINTILSASAFRIGLTAQFRICTRPQEYLQLCLDRLIDAAAKDPDARKLFEDFLHHYLYLENRTGWFPKKDILAILSTLFSLHNVYGLDLGYEIFNAESQIRRKSSLLKELRRLRDELPEGVHQRFRTSLEKFLDEHPHGFDIDDVPESFSKELPLKKDVDCPRSVEKLWEEIRADFKILCEEEAMGLFAPYAEIFEKIGCDFDAVCAKADIVFLSELNRKASKLFGSQAITLEEIYARLASRFRHYLVDEFQDTSRLQWSNIKPMAEEALSSGGTLFYVGDRKQAIYSFRGGDSRLFDKAQEELSVYPVQREVLTSNWRSSQEIITFNNAVFSPDHLKRFLRTKEAEQKSTVVFDEDDTSYVLSMFESAEQTSGSSRPGGYVEACVIDGATRAERDEAVRAKLVPLVRNLLQRFAPGEIAILSRGNEEVERITRWLMEEGLRVRSDRTSDLRENRLVREMAAFLAFLNSPIDDAAFAMFITGDLFAGASQMPSEVWHEFVFHCHKNSCHSCASRNPVSFQKTLDPGFRRDDRKENLSPSYLYIEFRKAYPEIWQKLIEPFFKNVGLFPLYELVVSIYHTTGCLEHFPGDHGFLMKFMELIKDQEDEYSDLGSFLDYYQNIEGEDVFVESVDDDAVHVMTIHKAKGLEFAAVILPSLVMDIQVGSGGENQPSFVPWQQDGRLRLLRLKSPYYKFSPELKNIYESEYKKALLSELNTVYVALTRAKEEIYAMVPAKAGSSFNPARWLLFPDPGGGPDVGECYTRGAISNRTPSKVSRAQTMNVSPSLQQDWVRFLRDEFTGEDALRRKHMKKGEILHAMLACAGDLSSQKTEDLEGLWSDILSPLDEAGRKEYISLVSSVTCDKNLKAFFYLSGAKVFNEFEIVNRFGDLRRIDRLIVTDKEVWIVDYKLGRDRPEQDRKQISEYKTLVAEIYPDKEIKAFLIYLGDNVETIGA